MSLNVCNIGLQCNFRFLSTTVLQGSVATRVNCGKIFNVLFITNLLLRVTVEEFWRSVTIRTRCRGISYGTSGVQEVRYFVNHGRCRCDVCGVYHMTAECLYYRYWLKLYNMIGKRWLMFITWCLSGKSDVVKFNMHYDVFLWSGVMYWIKHSNRYSRHYHLSVSYILNDKWHSLYSQYNLEFGQTLCTARIL